MQEAHDDTKPAYAPKKSVADDGRPKYGSRKIFFQRIWDRLHGSCHAMASIEALAATKERGAITMTTFGNRVFHPTPIRYAAPVSSHLPTYAFARIDDDNTVSSDEESLSGLQELIDNKNRRITLRIQGNVFTMNESKKRTGAFAAVVVSRKKTKW